MTDPASGSTGGGEPKSLRIADAVIGLILLVCAVLIALTRDEDKNLGALVAAAVLGVLGLQALLSAMRSRRSWLSHLGPLP